MLKRRDPVAIGNVGAYTERAGDYLKTALDKLIKDINSVLESYKGIDAETQVAKFIETANKINTVIQNLDYYGKYMKNVSSFDSDNLNTTKKNFSQMTTQPIVEEAELPTLALDSIKTETMEGNNE